MEGPAANPGVSLGLGRHLTSLAGKWEARL
jgi:hypothetical protein